MKKEEIEEVIQNYLKNNLKIEVSQNCSMYGVYDDEIKISLKIKDQTISTENFKIQTN